ncbi:MAG: cytidine deaminase [Lentisphaerota bacterium]
MEDFRAKLKEAALKARENAYAPYSGFRVGAAVRTTAGEVYSAANVENSSYGLTVCAERNAVFKAISEGHQEFTHLAICADTLDPTPPCGACLQVLFEFAPELEIILFTPRGKENIVTLDQLLPRGFGRRFLEKAK